MASLVGPPPPEANPLRTIAADLQDERRALRQDGIPPGFTSFSWSRTKAFAKEPLPVLLDAYERFGPVFTTRLLHLNVVWALGPEANTYILLKDPNNFLWREGSFADLIPLLGDGMLTIDGAFHRASRMALVPAFTKDRITKARTLIDSEVQAAIGQWRDGDQLDLMTWTRELALRIAMKALLGFDPDAGARGEQVPDAFHVACIHGFEQFCGHRALPRSAAAGNELRWSGQRDKTTARGARQGYDQPSWKRSQTAIGRQALKGVGTLPIGVMPWLPATVIDDQSAKPA